ncbi:MAG: hypothetical protein HY238_27880, partial [Acidobacteria bacterium]|nr:hypothetical protein [Acidobacteriota bacterium]
REGVECIENIRRRYDGERRNPWDEAECGHHYARAMAAWSAVPALSGFRYHGVEKSVTAIPRIQTARFSSIWSTATGWGTFAQAAQNGRTRFSLLLMEGTLPLRSVTLAAASGAKSSARLSGGNLTHEVKRADSGVTVMLAGQITLRPGQELVLFV